MNQIIHPHYFKMSLMGMALLHINGALHAEELTQQLDDIVLQAQTDSALLTSKTELKQVVGATNVIKSQPDVQRQQSNADLFQVQPGIYAQTAGNEGVKISIRGSGLNRGSGAHASGHYVLLDGIPFTGPGGTPYELLEPNWTSHTEVFRGSNGFERGALALGGAIQYTTPTGKEQQGGTIRLSSGAHDYQKYDVSYAQDLGKLDYSIAATYSESNGYQRHSASDAKGVMANLGYQINDHVDTRFYLRYRETKHQTPGRLTQEQIENDPEQANPYNLQINAHRIQPGSTWLANKTTWQLDQGGEFQASVAYHDYPMDLHESLYRVEVDYRDISANLRWKQPYMWLARNNIATVSLRSTIQPNSALGTESLRVDQPTAEAGALSRKYVHRGSDQVLTVNNDLEWRDNLWFSTGLATIYTQRSVDVTFPETDDKLKQNDWDYAYRLGFRYDLNDHQQFYSNISRSVEPAHAWSMLWGSDLYFPEGNGASTGRQRAGVPLKNQIATSFEIGGRGDSRFGEWDISYYYAQLQNELLMVERKPMPKEIIAESNASDTLHQGIEFGLESLLWSDDTWGDVSLKQAYTFNNFHYKKDAQFNQNELAGIPKHIYQAQLKYRHPQGVFVGLNTEYASKMPVDYANSRYTDQYHIIGLNMGWHDAKERLNLWLEMKNLTNEHYSATITPGFNDLGADSARATPGEGRSVYAGIGFKF